ncbi:hypothetical protein ABPG75_004912 [Micractinium tetrahymenae]
MPCARRDALAANQSAAGDAMDALCRAAETVLLATVLPGAVARAVARGGAASHLLPAPAVEEQWQQQQQQQQVAARPLAARPPSAGSPSDVKQLITQQAKQAQQAAHHRLSLRRPAAGKRRRGENSSPSGKDRSPTALRPAAARHRRAVARGVRAVLRHLPAEEVRSIAEAKGFLAQFPLQQA